MNYQFVYENIILQARSYNRSKGEIYYENHHIFPKCIGGKDEDLNLVLLTPREHYLCHKLLTFIYKNNYKLVSAFHYMTYNKRYDKFLSARDYEYERILYSSTPIPEETKIKLRKPKSDEHKQHLKDNHADISGKNNPMFGKKHSEKTRKKLSNKAKLRIKDKNGFFGKKHSDETKIQMRLSHNKENKSKYKIHCINNDKIYFSLRDVEKDLNVGRKKVSLCCKKLIPDVNGLVFEFL